MLVSSLHLIGVTIIIFHWQLSWSLPSGFVVEDVARVTAITGAFAWHKQNQAVLFLSSKDGRLMVLDDPDNSDNYSLVADFRAWMCVDGERGLQSIQPHPNFAVNRYLYAYYTQYKEGCKEDSMDGPSNRVSRFTVSKDFRIDRSTEQVLLELPPTTKHVHNGGSLAFGKDGKLYITTGDGGSREPAVSQDLGNLLGKIICLNDDGTIPKDNPFAKQGMRCGNSGGKVSKGTCSEM
jgi:glucose/arabinose dehydrogenase